MHVDASPQAIGCCYETSLRGATIYNPYPQAPIYVACFYGLLVIQRQTIIGCVKQWIVKTDNMIALAFFQKTRGKLHYVNNQLLCHISVFAEILKKQLGTEFVYVHTAENLADEWSRPSSNK